MAESNRDRRRAQALARYMVISAYLALAPPRGQRRAILEQLAAKVWEDADGQPLHVKAETLRVWVRRYRGGGLEALEDKPRPSRGIVSLTDEQLELACGLKREVPERSLDRLIRIMEEMKRIEPGSVRRSTLHRALQREGLSARQCRVPDRDDLDRFEAATPNDLWQSDMLEGPWLPDPERPGKTRRAHLYAFIDDHSRLLLHGRFSFKGDLPALELVFRRCLQKYGAPRRVYYDNGATYRSRHMKQIVAEVGIHPIIFTQKYRPMGHGKIEALNRYIRSAFLAEIKASRITTLDALNEAFLAWSDYEYNRKVHSETKEQPRERWRAGLEQVRYADEERLRLAFLWREDRTPDKAGVFSLFGTRYQVGPELARRRIEVRFDPEALDEVEVYFKGRFVERVRPFEVPRRFVHELDDSRYRVLRFSSLPTSITGFLRSLSRLLGLDMRLHAADMFDAAQKHLFNYADENGRHPILVIDDAEGLRVETLDLLRRLSAYELDAEDRFSILLAATEQILPVLRHPMLESLRSRIAYVQTLRPFSLEDTRNYVSFHLHGAGASDKLFSDEAIRRLFQASQGRPRRINQLALQVLIQAAVHGRDTIDGDFVVAQVAAHPLYQARVEDKE